MERLTESLEKYLLAIHELSKTNDSIMVKDVSEYLKIGGASTADAIKSLCKKNYINYVPYCPITLTQKGQEAVELKIYRHETISKFFNRVLDIEINEARQNATIMEYSLTEDVLEKLVHFLDFTEQCACKEPKWVKSSKYTLQNGEMSNKCKICKSNNKSCGSCCKM